eukprot:Lankesteria_metandrocarpae@DN4310_c0_g1_i1.p1
MGEESIRVCIRQRPLFTKEKEAGHSNAWSLQTKGELTLKLLPEVDDYTTMGMRAAISRMKKTYFFDRCYDENWGNDTIYNETARDIILDTLKGISGCYIAYGQTGCGKTHSIMGTAADPGILPRSLSDLFDVIKHGEPDADDGTVTEYMLRISYLEIYKERVVDLFDFEAEDDKFLDVKEDPKAGFFVVGLKEVNVTRMTEVLDLLGKAERKRHFACTNFNEMSSRSHTVFTCILEKSETLQTGEVIARRGELKLVDLAGNERVGELSIASDPKAKARMAEGQAINRSLFLLSEVISKLSKRSGGNKDVFIPWRDSKLTRILQKALGGNSRACLLVAIHPSTQAMEITLSTLRFASKSKMITKKVQTNFLTQEQSLIANQKDEITRLKEELDLLRQSVDPELIMQLPLTQERRDELAQRLQQAAGELPTALPTHIVELQAELEAKVEKLHRIILERSSFGSKPTSPAISSRSTDYETWAAARPDQLQQLMRLGTITSSPYELTRKQKQLQRRPPKEPIPFAEVEESLEPVAAYELYESAASYQYQSQLRKQGTISIDDPTETKVEKAARELRRSRRDNTALLQRLRQMKMKGQRFEDLVNQLGLSPLIQSAVRLPAGTGAVDATARLDTLKLRLHDLRTNPNKDKMHPFVTGLLSRILCQGIMKGMELAGAPQQRKVGQQELSTTKVRSSVRKASADTVAQEGGSKRMTVTSDASELTAEGIQSGEQKEGDGLTLAPPVNGKRVRKVKKADNAKLVKLPQTGETEQWVLSVLEPHDAHVLGVLYEQQAFRDSLCAVRDEVAEKMKTINEKVNSVQADRVALADGTSSLVKEVRTLNEILSSKEPQKKNWLPEFTQLVARLVKRLDDLSITAAQHKTETLLMKDELDMLKAQQKQLLPHKQDLTDVILDSCIPVFSEQKVNDFTETETVLYRALLEMQQKVTFERTDSTEKRLLASDFRLLCTDLVTGIHTTEQHSKSVVAEAKLSEASARRDSVHYMKLSKTLEEQVEDQDFELLNARRTMRALQAETRRLRDMEEKYNLHLALEEQMFRSTRITTTSAATSGRSSPVESASDLPSGKRKKKAIARRQSTVGLSNRLPSVMPSRMSSLRPSQPPSATRRPSMSALKDLSGQTQSGSAPISGRQLLSKRRPSVSTLIARKRPSALGRRVSVSALTAVQRAPTSKHLSPAIAGRRSSVKHQTLKLSGDRISSASKLAMPVIFEGDGDGSDTSKNSDHDSSNKSVESDFVPTKSAESAESDFVPAKSVKSDAKKSVTKSPKGKKLLSATKSRKSLSVRRRSTRKK